MEFLVTDVRFDFIIDDDQLSPEEQLEIINETCGIVWKADNEVDLVEEIVSATGWLIKSIEYVRVSQSMHD